MSSSNGPVQWTEQQWNSVQQVVHDEAHKARVAARFLPLFGPLPADAETVPAQTVTTLRPDERYGEPERLSIDDVECLRLTTVAVNVFLNGQQVAQPDLSSALTVFRRAANIVARVEDAIIFRGQPGAARAPEIKVPSVFQVTGGSAHRGLLSEDNHAAKLNAKANDGRAGQMMVRTVADGVAELEARGYPGPYALALGNDLFVAVETPTESMVLPSDRIRPIIEGPLVRTSTLPGDAGVLVALSGNPVEIVVARDIGVRFLQVTTEPRYVYRVSERFVLRIKERDAIVSITSEGY